MTMRSILIFPATRRALEQALASETDALAVDFSGASDMDAAAIIGEAHARGKKCLAQIHALDSGLADADLDAVMPGRPDGIILPDACGGRDVQHLGAKLAVREAENDLPEGVLKILALAGDSPAALFELGSIARASRRLIGLAATSVCSRKGWEFFRAWMTRGRSPCAWRAASACSPPPLPGPKPMIAPNRARARRLRVFARWPRAMVLREKSW